VKNILPAAITDSPQLILLLENEFKKVKGLVEDIIKNEPRLR